MADCLERVEAVGVRPVGAVVGRDGAGRKVVERASVERGAVERASVDPSPPALLPVDEIEVLQCRALMVAAINQAISDACGVTGESYVSPHLRLLTAVRAWRWLYLPSMVLDRHATVDLAGSSGAVFDDRMRRVGIPYPAIEDFGGAFGLLRRVRVELAKPVPGSVATVETGVGRRV